MQSRIWILASLVLASGCATKQTYTPTTRVYERAFAGDEFAVLPMESSADAREMRDTAQQVFVDRLEKSHPDLDLVLPDEVLRRASDPAARRTYDAMMDAHFQNNRRIPPDSLRAFRDAFGTRYVIVTVLLDGGSGATVEGQLWDANSGELVWERVSTRDSAEYAAGEIAYEMGRRQPPPEVVARPGADVGAKIATDVAVTGCLLFFEFLAVLLD